MKWAIAAALAGVVLASSGAASSATYIIDFENYAAGDILNSADYRGTPLQGSPYRVAYANGSIVADPRVSGNVLSVAVDPWNDDAWVFFNNFRTDIVTPAGDLVYAPRLKSIDIFVPQDTRMNFSGRGYTDLQAGEWLTYSPDQILKGTFRLRLSNVPYAYVDNIVLEDNFAVVPEPATWAMMIMGFGIAGAALRRQAGKFVVRAS